METDQHYIDFLEKKGYIVFKNAKELKQIVLETLNYQELIDEILKRNLENDCGCNNN